MTEPLTEESLQKACDILAQTEPAFASVIARYGYPPLWDRPPGFETLLRIILEQQVSLASAQAAYQSLLSALGTITPQSFLTLTDGELKKIGFSRQKTRYGRILSQTVLNGNPLEKLNRLGDDEAALALQSITGIGKWTSAIYLLMAMCRPDIWPDGDRALAVSAKEVFELDNVPSYDDLRAKAASWKPYRAAAARLLWHNYLERRRKTIS